MQKKDSMNWNSVYALVKKIPRGRVITYGQLAKALRLAGGARTAGHAMAACPSGRGVPWHRVVGAGGKLLIREPHASLQRKLLESEGLMLAEKRILNFSDYCWDLKKTRLRKSSNKSIRKNS
jgi:methylated-DNA-protein-cysteine methyltransferase-like protein